MRFRFAALFVVSPLVSSEAQNPGQHVTVRVNPTAVVIRGDTVGMTAIVSNSSSSTESLLTFVVDAPGGVTFIRTPEPAVSWDAGTRASGRPAAVWSSGELVSPGASTPELYFEAVGLPGILTYWAGGDYPYPSYDDGEAVDTGTFANPLETAMISGKTVGVEAWPNPRTAQALLSRLRSLTQSACSRPLFWIANGTLCAQLVRDLDHAEAHRLNGEMSDARNSLARFVTSLSGSSPDSFAPGVTSSGYWLLRPNADIVTRLLS